jgi:hypothetical protein
MPMVANIAYNEPSRGYLISLLIPKIKSENFIVLKILPYTIILPLMPESFILNLIILEMNSIINEAIKAITGININKNERFFILLLFKTYKSVNKRLAAAVIYVLPYVNLKITILIKNAMNIRRNLFLQKNHIDKVNKNKNKACEFGL